MKKGLAIFLAFLMLFQFVPLEAAQVRAASPNTYDGNPTSVGDWETYKTVHHLDSSLPSSIKVKNGSTTAWFNKELWEDKSLVVYGEANLASTKSTDWKAGTQNPNGTPYYTKNGVKGEYRYHGWDRSGNLIPNEHFIDDATSSATLEEKTWVYHPWDAGSPAYDSFLKNIGSISDYNKFALNDRYEDSPKVAKWINQSLNFTITNSTNSDKNPVHYNNISSAPTGYSSGEGTMFHQSNTTGKIWYQTFSVPKYNKDDTPLNAAIPEIYVLDIADNGDVTLKVKVTGELLDDSIFGDSLKESIYYHRGDVKEWNFTLKNSLTSEVIKAKGTPIEKNKKSYHYFTFKIPRTAYQGYTDDKGNFQVNLTGIAEVTYSTGEKRQATATQVKDIKGIIEEDKSVPPPADPLVPEPIIIDFDVIAPHKMLDVDKFDLTLIENDVSKAYDRSVYIDGVKLSEAGETRFLSGQHTFPRLREDRVYSYSIVYTDIEGGIWFFSSYVVVYDSVPHAQVLVGGSHKVNRKIDVSADKSITSDYLESRSTVVISEFTVTTDDGQPIYFGSNTSSFKEFLRKTEGNINVHVKVSNEYGYRTYDHQIYVSPDYEPDVIATIWNNVLTRNEGLDILAEGASLDSDIVTNLTYQILYDTNNDGNPETVVYSGTWNGSTIYKPDKLGKYKIVFKATENFGQPTISQHITEADKRTKIVEREFFVDNLIPMTKLYADIEYNFPKLDVVFLTDQNLPRAENDYIRDSNVDITNNFRANSMVANVDLWDLHTYVYSQTAYDQKNTGTTYPSNTIQYSNGGYAGTLNLYNVRNYPYEVDNGGYQTFSDSRTEYDSYDYETSTTYEYTGGGWKEISRDWSVAPSSMYYNDGQYSGTLSRKTPTKTGSSDDKPSNPSKGDTYTATGYWTAPYSGTVTYTWREYVPKYVTYNNYYGDYSGTVYKNVKQIYTPTYQTESSKYIIYMTKDSINNISDLYYVKDIARDSKVIFIGNPALQGQFAYDYFIPYSTDTNQLINEVIKITKAENPLSNELAVLINQPFNLNYTDIDEEGDPIVESGFQYVHDQYYFDNPLGLETGARTSYSDTGYITTKKSILIKPGKYTMYRRIKDAPVGFASLGGYSNLGTIEVVAHRKPIAKATLDWDFDPVSGTYKTRWVDQGYDPDFQYKDANKGIVDRKIKYKSSTGNWIYEIPNNLAPGTYTVEYIVMDKHGVWSTPWVMNFTLASVPDIQILDAKAKPQDSQFTLAGVPASENLILYDVKTRYPYDTYLDIAIYQNGIKKTTSKIVNYSSGVTGTKFGNDISWYNISYNIPSTLPDGSYQIRVTATSTTGGKSTYKEIPLTVSTPINLKIVDFPITMTNVGGIAYAIKAETSKYVDQVRVTIYKGTGYQTYIYLTKGTLVNGVQSWSTNYTVPTSIPPNTYTIEYQARTTNLKYGYATTNTQIINVNLLPNVYHTPEWDAKRIELGRAANVFFAGEEFQLKADTTSNVTAVKAIFNFGTFGTYSTYLIPNTAKTLWNGTLWRSNFKDIPNGSYTVRFEATYSGGTKVENVPIIIDGTIYDDLGVHRVK